MPLLLRSEDIKSIFFNGENFPYTISILLVSNWPSKMFVMVLKKLGDHFN